MSHIGKKYRFLKKYVCILVGLWLRSKPNLAFSKNLSLDPLVALPMEKIPKTGLKGCKWSSFKAPGTEIPFVSSIFGVVRFSLFPLLASGVIRIGSPV